MFKLFGKVLNEYFNTTEFKDEVIYFIDKTDAGNGPGFYPYWINNPTDKYSKAIDEDTMIKLHTIYIQNKMKDERDFYEGEIKGINYFINRFNGYFNGYIELSEDDFYKIDITSLDVHGGTSFEGDIKVLKLPAGNYRIDSKAIGFSTDYESDAYLNNGLINPNGEYRDYQFVYNELVKLVNQLPKEMLTTDGQRYFKNFVQEVKDFSNLSEGDFFMKYCLSGEEEHDIKKEYESYSKYEMQEDELSYEEWLEEVYYEDNQDTITERVREYREPGLDFIEYKDSNSDNSIYEITLARGGPNVYLTINTRWQSALYEFVWGGENLSENLSYLYDELISYFNIY